MTYECKPINTWSATTDNHFNLRDPLRRLSPTRELHDSEFKVLTNVEYAHLQERLSRVGEQVAKAVTSNLELHLPGQTALEIQKQLPNIINNHHQMQLMLKAHLLRLQAELDLHVRNIITEIVNDPKYHTINQSYFNTVLTNGDAAIAKLRVKADSELSELRTELHQCKQLGLRLGQAELRLADTETKVIILMVLSVIGAVFFAIILLNSNH